jgi:hypothetical protein
MTPPSGATSRPRAYDADAFPWNLHRVPATAILHGKEVPHPGRRGAIFVVHGMGEQEWTGTAAHLRSGCEDAIDAIRRWQKDNPPPDGRQDPELNRVPSPFILDGYWANYDDVETSFPEDWSRFVPRERSFFARLWKRRSYSLPRTFGWYLLQQVSLLHPRAILEGRIFTWLLYWPMQVVSLAGLIVALITRPRIITRTLADVRLYANPRGMVERAIVQRIDKRVGDEFLRLLGLDWDFRSLDPEEQISCSGTPIVFDHVVWVAHSLGSVVSYNALSDLFHRANELRVTGDPTQRRGVDKFTRSLRRFVTLGSPLDKFAFLFADALRPWPADVRNLIVDVAGPGAAGGAAEEGRWWVNFYNVLDPVSGSLDNPLICAQSPPFNLHAVGSLWAFIPGCAHQAYWESRRVLRFLLSRTYGQDWLRDRTWDRQSPTARVVLALVGYVVWAVILGGGVLLIYATRGTIIRWITGTVVGLVKHLVG